MIFHKHPPFLLLDGNCNKSTTKQQNQKQFSSKTKANLVKYYALLVGAIVLTTSSVSASPPLDFFIQTAPKNGERHLQSLDSIFKQETKPTTFDNDRVVKLLKNSSHTHNNDMTDMQATKIAWSLMEQQALAYMQNKVDSVKPLINELLSEANVSSQCSLAIDDWLDGLKRLDSWPVTMWNAWGSLPGSGFSQGSFTDLGSYKGCLSLAQSNSGDNEKANTNYVDKLGEPQYCTLDYQPLVPTRPRFHSVLKQVLRVDMKTGELTNGDFESAGGLVNSKTSSHGFSSHIYRSLMSSSEALPSAGSNNGDSKYSKRTILHNDSFDPSGELQNANVQALKIKSEAFADLALKAHYFYYVKLRLGACLPSKCSVKDVESLAQTAGLRALLQSSHVNCMKKEVKVLNNYQRFAIFVLGGLALIASFFTLLDFLGYKDDCVTTFSIWSNSKRLFDSESINSHTDLGCIHGLRFFSMIWVIYGHTILYSEYQSFTHFYDAVEVDITNILLLPLFNANFSVDTFFVISGLLTTYVTWEYTKGDVRKFNKFAFAISRYIRLTPQLAIVILCFFLLPLFGSGPMYDQITEKEAGRCRQNWLINLLYMQTYINSTETCIDPSWWLSIEMTFHMVSIPIIVMMINNARRGMIANFLIGSSLSLYGAYVHYKGGFAIQYLPSIPQRYEIFTEQTNNFFHLPFPHTASYFIGLALGYVLANRTIKKLGTMQKIQGWIVCALCLIIPMWGSHLWNLGMPYTQWQATLYYNVCQILWPVAISWIIFVCSLGHGGVVESILSAKCFVPLGRVTYMTYLSHALIIYFHSASMNVPVEPSLLFFTYVFIANAFLALILGTILTVLYESPILNLQKLLLTYLTAKFEYKPPRNDVLQTA